MDTLKPHSNGPLYNNTVLVQWPFDGWTVTFGTARRGLGGLRPRPVPSLLYQMYVASTARVPLSYYSMWHGCRRLFLPVKNFTLLNLCQRRGLTRGTHRRTTLVGFLTGKTSEMLICQTIPHHYSRSASVPACQDWHSLWTPYPTILHDINQ